MMVAAGYIASPGRRSRPLRRLARSPQAVSLSGATGVTSVADTPVSHGEPTNPAAPMPVARSRVRRLTPRDERCAIDEVFTGMGFLSPPPYEADRRRVGDRSFARAPSYQSGDRDRAL